MAAYVAPKSVLKGKSTEGEISFGDSSAVLLSLRRECANVDDPGHWRCVGGGMRYAQKQFFSDGGFKVSGNAQGGAA